ncbi:hypothetical protein [Formosa sp. S-31]|uniref:hypothetical protein n=1 Tax=Formosa sp. S-31 TaxID=2790949 RepID=UPI003EBC24AE
MKMFKKKFIPFGVVYTATNKVTEQVYVGATTKTLHQRKLDHIERANRGEANKFHNAIAKYGANAFE